MRTAVLLPLLWILAGCHAALTPEEKARQDARDVAMVERAQKQLAPAQPVTLQAIPAREQAMIPPEGKGCTMVLNEDLDGDPVGLFGTVTGHIRLNGKLLALAPDTGAAKVRGVYGKYVGKTHVVRLQTATQGDGVWIAVLDPHDRPVYFAPGELRCTLRQAQDERDGA
jgi:hypothetical protein